MSKLTNKIIRLNNRRTSIRLCESEWTALEDLCKKENLRRNALINILDNKKNKELTLTGTIRLFAISYYHRLSQNNDTTHHHIISKLFSASDKMP